MALTLTDRKNAGRKAGGPAERGPRGRGGLDSRLDQLSRDLNRMREQLDGLREGLRGDTEDDEDNDE